MSIEDMQYVTMRVMATVRIEKPGDAEAAQREAIRRLKGIGLEGVGFSEFEVVSIRIGEV